MEDLRKILSEELQRLVDEAKKLEEKHESELTSEDKVMIQELGKIIEILKIHLDTGKN